MRQYWNKRLPIIILHLVRRPQHGLKRSQALTKVNHLSFCTKKLEDETLDAEGRWNIPVIICEDRGFRDELKNRLHDVSNAVAATTIIKGHFNGSGRSRLSLGRVKDTLNGEESREEIH